MEISIIKDRRTDVGLLILRSAGLFLAITFGRQKVLGFVAFLGSGLPLGSFGFTQFLSGLGFPAPGLLAVCAVLNESIVACLITVGFLCRFSSAVAALGMAVAFFVSLKLGEEPFRAMLYCAAFAALAITGPGRLSIDHWLSASFARKPRGI